MNCEYKLYVLNQETPLRNNPFLSHWVEAIQRLERAAAKSSKKSSGAELTSNEINVVRVEFIKTLLQSRNALQFARASPRQLYGSFVELGQTAPFYITTYIRMLEEEGIYERTPEPPEFQHISHDTPVDSSKEKAPARPKLSNFQQWKHDVLDRLQTNPNTAIHELTHLPIELSYLDFLTTLLQERTLQSFSIDPAPVISDYIQHALRLTEQMGQPPSSSSDPSSTSNGAISSEEVVDHGREAQARAVKLLLLFVKNLIRKDLVPTEAIYFEIQEICVRYVWVREVREFRSFVEEGLGGEGGGLAVG